MVFEAPRIAVDGDFVEVNRDYLSRGWTDGLPIVPPTEDLVLQMLAGIDLDPSVEVATLPPSGRVATVEAIAINAVMAGCVPAYLPVVVAGLRAMAEPAFNLIGTTTTTHPCAPMMIVNGPIARQLGINAGAGALGPGSAANASIGRAIRLLLLNVGGALPGTYDQAALGHPGKYTYCFAENEDESPWEPLHVERGYRADENTVTLIAAEGPHNINDHFSNTAEGLLTTVAGSMAQLGANDMWYEEAEPVVILGPEHASVIARGGYSKSDVKQWLSDHAKLRLSAFSLENQVGRFVERWPDKYRSADPEETWIRSVNYPEKLILVVAGGPGKHSAHAPTAGNFYSVTKRIDHVRPESMVG